MEIQFTEIFFYVLRFTSKVHCITIIILCFYSLNREGILCIFNNKQDSKPQYFLQVGGEDCSGCRRSKNSDREHSFEINKTDGSSWQIAAASEHEANDWLQSLCQCAAESTEVNMNHLSWLYVYSI